jgi:hypothetical protein
MQEKFLSIAFSNYTSSMLFTSKMLVRYAYNTVILTLLQ